MLPLSIKFPPYTFRFGARCNKRNAPVHWKFKFGFFKNKTSAMYSYFVMGGERQGRKEDDDDGDDEDEE